MEILYCREFFFVVEEPRVTHSPRVGCVKIHRKKVWAIESTNDFLGPSWDLTLGQGEPQAVVAVKNGKWTLSPLEQRASSRPATPDSNGNLLPEMAWSELAPGTPIIEETSKSLFLKKLRAIEWKYGGID
jgi:hypothetical protein